MNLSELKEEYANQDNRATAYPIYVTVQELFCVGVIEDGYSVNCPYGDGKTVTKYRLRDGDSDSPEADSEDELKEKLRRDGYDDDVDDNEIISYQLGYIWHSIEFFLTIKGAEQYIRANKHHHRGELRTYVHYLNGLEMRELLNEIGFKIKD